MWPANELHHLSLHLTFTYTLLHASDNLRHFMPTSSLHLLPRFRNSRPITDANLLSVDEPVSPDSPSGSIYSEGSPTRIVSKRLKRRSVPRSLTLTKSNGSTAESPKEQTVEEKSLPPPPPEKSTRRNQTSAMGNHGSKGKSPRKDSLHSQDGGYDAREPVKRKELPKFTSLAELGKGPRGGKGGPLPQPRARKPSFEAESDEDRGRSSVRSNAESKIREAPTPRLRERAAPIDTPPSVNNPLPPTPNEEPVAAPPPPTKKPFGGMGLPSNPRHKKGKSSTGFDFLKSATSPLPQPPQEQQLPAPITLTPRPTPSPIRTPQMHQDEIVEIGDPQMAHGTSNAPRRPFSFEPPPPVSTSPPLKESLSNAIEDQNTTAGTAPKPPSPKPTPTAPVVSPLDPPPPAAATTTTTTDPPAPDFPPRSTSRVALPPAFTSLPSQQRSGMSDVIESAPESPSEIPFVPLTASPVPKAAAPITEKHHNCYSNHATFVWSRNDFQPMACMICNKNDQERKWACVWCYLRICVECSTELQKTPSRDLKAVLEKRAAQVTYGGEEYEEEGEGLVEGMHPGFEGGVPVTANGKRHDSGNPTLVVWDADAEDAGDRVDFS